MLASEMGWFKDVLVQILLSVRVSVWPGFIMELFLIYFKNVDTCHQINAVISNIPCYFCLCGCNVLSDCSHYSLCVTSLVA